MALYPGLGHASRVVEAALRAAVESIFVGCGMGAIDAALLADTLVHADLRGIHSHGVLRVPEYVAKLTEGGVDPVGRPLIVRENASALVIDGGNSMGQIGAAFAMRAAIERAGTRGVAAARGPRLLRFASTTVRDIDATGDDHRSPPGAGGW